MVTYSWDPRWVSLKCITLAKSSTITFWKVSKKKKKPKQEQIRNFAETLQQENTKPYNIKPQKRKAYFFLIFIMYRRRLARDAWYIFLTIRRKLILHLTQKTKQNKAKQKEINT